jgi:hypothetical protein
LSKIIRSLAFARWYGRDTDQRNKASPLHKDSIMSILRRHIFATLFLGIYFICWGYTIHWFTSENANYPNSCGAANVGMIVIILAITASYSIIFFVNVLLQKGDNKLDYLKFLLAIISVPVAIWLYLTIASFFITFINQ